MGCRGVPERCVIRADLNDAVGTQNIRPEAFPICRLAIQVVMDTTILHMRGTAGILIAFPLACRRKHNRRR